MAEASEEDEMENELSCGEDAEHVTLQAGALGLMIDYRHHLERTHEVPGPIPSGITLVQLIGMHQRMHEQEREDGGVPEGEPVFEHFARIGTVEGADGRWLPDFPGGPLGVYPLLAICGHCGASITAEGIGLPWQVVAGSAPDQERITEEVRASLLRQAGYQPDAEGTWVPVHERAEAPDPESYMNDLDWQQEYADHLQSAGEVEIGLGDFDGGVDA